MHIGMGYMSPASSCHCVWDLWIIEGNSWRIHDGTAGMTKNPEVLGLCRGSRGWREEKGGRTREGGEREVERGERARGAFCGVERRRICSTLQRILAPICENFKIKKILVWRRCREEGIELGGGGFWEDSMGLGSEEVEEDMSAASGDGRKRGSADFELLSSSSEVFLQSFQALGLKEESVFFVLIFGL